MLSRVGPADTAVATEDAAAAAGIAAWSKHARQFATGIGNRIDYKEP